MSNKKSAPPQKIYICFICGKEIHGDCEHIKTKGQRERQIHFECVSGKVNNKS